jgi:hypothetical protein
MKATIIKLFFFLFSIVSFSGFADKILLTGKPVILLPQDDYYRFPITYTPFTNYHFVNISGDNRVCFLSQQKRLESLDLLRIYIVQNDKKLLWFCYRYNPAYFTIDF